MTRQLELNSEPLVAIATVSTDIYSETFIRQHIEELPFSKIVLSGFDLAQTTNGTNLLDRRLCGRALQQLQKQLGIFDFEAFRTQRVAKHLKDTKVSAVLAEYGPTAAKMVDPCTIAGVPLIAHFHGFDAYVHDVLEMNQHAYAKLFRAAAAIIAVSKEMKAQLESLGAPSAKIHKIAYLVDPNRFTAVAPERAPMVFLAVGRFVEKKAPQLTLLAFSKVIAQVPSAKLVFAGDGVLLGPTMQLAKSLGISDSVKFLGSLPHEEVAKQMQQASCFVQHSIKAINGDSEGTPVSVLEAQACGLPVVATRHSGIKDVVIDGQTGFLVDELDVTGMADAMVRIAQDPILASRMGRSGALRIRDKFSRSETLGKLAAVISAVSTNNCKPTDREAKL